MHPQPSPYRPRPQRRPRLALSLSLLLSMSCTVCGLPGDPCGSSGSCFEGNDCIECSGQNVCFASDQLDGPTGYDLACALYGGGVPTGQAYVDVGGVLRPPPDDNWFGGEGEGEPSGAAVAHCIVRNVVAEPNITPGCTEFYSYDAAVESACDHVTTRWGSGPCPDPGRWAARCMGATVRGHPANDYWHPASTCSTSQPGVLAARCAGRGGSFRGDDCDSVNR